MDQIDLKDKEIIYLKEEPDFKTIQKIVKVIKLKVFLF